MRPTALSATDSQKPSNTSSRLDLATQQSSLSARHIASLRLASATPLLQGLFVPAEVVAQWEHYARDEPFVDQPSEQMCSRLTLFIAEVQQQDMTSTPNPATQQNDISRGAKKKKKKWLQGCAEYNTLSRFMEIITTQLFLVTIMLEVRMCGLLISSIYICQQLMLNITHKHKNTKYFCVACLFFVYLLYRPPRDNNYPTILLQIFQRLTLQLTSLNSFSTLMKEIY